MPVADRDPDVDESQDDIDARVLAKFPQEHSVGVVEGPHTVGCYEIARVWARNKKSGEYHAHHHVRDGEVIHVFHNFAPFALWLDKQAVFGDDRAHVRKLDMLKAWVASILVLGALALTAYGFWKTQDVSKFVGQLVAGVLLGAAGYLFATAANSRNGR